MDEETLHELANDFIQRFPPEGQHTTLSGADADDGLPGRPARWLLNRHGPAIMILALGYSRIRSLERFVNIVDARQAEDTYSWDVRQRRRWAKENGDSISESARSLYLEKSRPTQRKSDPSGERRSWQDAIQSFEWSGVGHWGPGRLPVGQEWRLERLKALYIITESLALAEGEHVARAFLLGRNPYLGAAPLSVLADSGRTELENILQAVNHFFQRIYGSSSLG